MRNISRAPVLRKVCCFGGCCAAWQTTKNDGLPHEDAELRRSQFFKFIFLRRRQSSGPMALLIFLTAAARARLITADLLTFNDGLGSAGGSISTDKLQIGHLFVLLLLDLAGHI